MLREAGVRVGGVLFGLTLSVLMLVDARLLAVLHLHEASWELSRWDSWLLVQNKGSLIGRLMKWF